MEDKSLKAIFSAAAAAFSIYFNMLAVPVAVLIAAMAADYLTGLYSAYINRCLSSKTGLKGIIKKLGYLMLIAAAMFADYLIHAGFQYVNIKMDCSFWAGILVTFWLIVNELISIIENLIKTDIPVPKFLSTLIAQLKDRIEKR